jgi:hypothetical protein
MCRNINVPDYLQYHVQDVQSSTFLKAFFHCRLQWRCHFKMVILLQMVAAIKDSPNFQTQAYNLYIVSNNSLIYSKMHLMWVLKLIINVHIHAFLYLLYLTIVKRKWRNNFCASLPLVAKLGNLSSLFWGKEWGGAGGLASYQFLSYQQRQMHGQINYEDTKAKKCCYLKYLPVKGLYAKCLSVCATSSPRCLFLWCCSNFVGSLSGTESQTPAQYTL